MELMKAILERRSVRRYTEEPVTDGELAALFEAARYAPSWANTQTWHFIVIRDREIIRQVTETYSETNPARKCSFTAPALIAACGRKGVAGFRGEEQRTRYAHWFMFDLGMAVQNLCLRAHELGLGTVVVGSLDHERCDRVLGLPDELETVVVIPVGRTAGEGKPAPKRKELAEIIHLDSFGRSFTGNGS